MSPIATHECLISVVEKQPPACQCGECTSDSDIDILIYLVSTRKCIYGLPWSTRRLVYPCLSHPIIRSIQVDFVHLNFSTSSRSFGQLGFPPATRCERMGRSRCHGISSGSFRRSWLDEIVGIHFDVPKVRTDGLDSPK